MEKAQDIPRVRVRQKPMYVIKITNMGTVVDTIYVYLIDPSSLDPITAGGTDICNP